MLSGTCCNLILFCLVLESQNIDLVSICVILQEHGSIFAKYFCNCVKLLPFWESNILPHRALPTEDTCSSRGDWNRGAMIWWMQWRPGQRQIWRHKVDFVEVEPKRQFVLGEFSIWPKKGSFKSVGERDLYCLCYTQEWGVCTLVFHNICIFW